MVTLQKKKKKPFDGRRVSANWLHSELKDKNKDSDED